MNILKPVVLLLGAATYFCATAASPELSAPPVILPDGCPAYAGAIEVAETTGGQESSFFSAPKISNNDFTAALTSTLAGLGTSGSGQYRLAATITELEQPAFSLDTTVGLKVRYQLTELSTGSVAFDQVVDSTFTAKKSSASKGAARVKIANAGAVQQNINNAVMLICGGGVD